MKDKELATVKEIQKDQSKKIQLLNNELDLQKQFIHKRELFKNHGFSAIKDSISDHYTSSKDTYRGKAFNNIHAETKSVKIEITKIINEEAREFDDQLYKVQSNQNNR